MIRKQKRPRRTNLYHSSRVTKPTKDNRLGFGISVDVQTGMAFKFRAHSGSPLEPNRVPNREPLTPQCSLVLHQSPWSGYPTR